ncbi:NUMOD4 domain-containing protein [Bacillus cereus]
MRRVHEVWKPVKGYEGLYKVSNQGRVKSLDRKVKAVKRGKEYEITVKGKLFSMPESAKYYTITLHKEGKPEQKVVHRMVAEVFVENPEGKPFVNHIDADKHNNKASNLEWVTAKENTRHAQKLGNMRKAKPYWYDLY